MPRMILLLSLLLACSACNPETPAEPETQTLSFQASLSGGVKSKWLSGDKVSVISVENGVIASVDSFTAKSEGQVAQFSGTYTGSDHAAVVVVYPAMENSAGQVYESAALFGNENGFFRAVKGTGYFLFAPKEGMTVKQTRNASTSGLEPMDFMMAGSSAQALGGSSIALQRKTAWLKISLDTQALEKGEKARQLTLSLDEGTPFTTYRGSMAPDASKTQWTTNAASGSFQMELSDVEAGTALSVYVPVFPNTTGASLSGSALRSLTLDVSTGSKLYSASVSIPSQSADFDLTSGKQIALSGVLAPKTVNPVDEPAIKSFRKIMDKGPSALCVDGDILYVGASGSIYAMDISNPKEPRQIGSVTFPGSARQVVACNGKLAVSARETGVWIFDASDPANLSLISRYDGIELSTGIDLAGDCIVVGERQTGVEFVDGRNLSKPEHIRVIKTPESQTVFYANGYLFSGEWAAGQVTVFNARDLGNIQQVSTLQLDGYGDGVWVTGNRLYASTGHHHRKNKTVDGDGHGVEIWDIANPADPRLLSRTEFDIFYMSGTDCWLNRPSGDCKTLYCGDVYNGLYVVDITNEKKPKIIGHWDPVDNTPDNKKHAITSVALAQGVCYVTVGSEGLYLLESSRANPSKRDRGTLPSNLGARWKYETPSNSHFNTWVPDKRGQVKGAAVYGDALFVGCGDAGLYTVKKDAQGKPYKFAYLNIPFAGGVAVKGNLLFVARGQQGLGVYRIGSNLALTEVALLKNELYPNQPRSQFSYWVSVPNDKYVVNSSRNGYQFLAIGGTEDAPSFTFRRQYNLNLNYNRYISEKASTEGMLSYATRSGLAWINLGSSSSVPAPSVVENLTNSLTEGSTLFKNNQFLLSRSHTLCTIAPGGSQILVTSPENDGFAGIPRWESGNTVLICNFVSRFVSKVNAYNLANPTLQFKEETVGYPEPGLFWNGKCVIPCGYQGLLIEK